MSKRRVLPQNQESMLEWLEQRRIALIAAYRAALLADGPNMTMAQLDAGGERWAGVAGRGGRGRAGVRDRPQHVPRASAHGVLISRAWAHRPRARVAACAAPR